MRGSEIYKDCLTAHAGRWISEGKWLPILEYLEFRGGPLISHYIRKKGPKRVIIDFAKAIEKIK